MQIDENEYKQLIEIKNKYSMMLKALFKNAGLSYMGNELEFSFSDICTLVEYLESEQYEKKLEELKEEKRKKADNV